MTRSILMTGCSSGIGHHAAHALARRGWQVLATCRKPSDCERLRREGLVSFPLDLADPASIDAAWARAMEETGGTLDALFNNGAFACPGAVEDLPTGALREIFEVNVFAQHELARRALGVMRRAGAGRIVQNSSVLGFVGLRMRGAYVSTKFALEGLTDVLRLELRGSGIHAILLEPGPIRTRIRENSRTHFERWIDREASVWRDFYRSTVEPRLYAENPAPDRWELGCEATTAKLVRALEDPRPQARYRVTTPTYMMAGLKRALPTRALDAVLMRG